LSKSVSKHFWGTEIGMVFQDPMTSLNPVKRIDAHFVEPLRFHLGLARKAARERAVELLGMVGIPAPERRLSQYPHELSGGMRQRITIALALSC
jgi:peptide/nickel transport system ATP-binding protein